MIRAVRHVPLVLLLPLVLAGCGTESATSGSSSSGSSSSGPSRGAASSGPAPDRAELEARADYMQSAMEHIYVTEVAGYDLAKQSVGVSGGDGFSSVYVSRSGGQIRLEVDRGTLTEANCAERPVYQAEGQPVTCERDGTSWYRTAGNVHEYAWSEDGHVVRIGADRALDRDTLRSAAKATHPADDRELDEILPEKTAPAAPVERGDLPPVGDGAPNNDVGAGG
ncbi:hypothetical protein OG883_20640 [Streptomyces sp. NBC_01142]|uniref:hypothetical protein n=1 Tax=Streptomyces sp. NBC_01142 TaxID=2975865 RepID=UPI00224E1AFE|nr:hypothetical protein [Streptomyces sp. NBC_01142]MCX4822250.1 hypothetical protein [Streptomyces sp. NBC_01142]